MFSCDVDPGKMCALNVTDKIENIKKCIAHWKRRSLTVIGTITAIKSLFLPMLTHCFISSLTQTNKILDTLSNIFTNFVWGKTVKIKHNVAIQDYSKGELRFPDVKAYVNRLKLSWIGKLAVNKQSQCFKLVGSIFKVDRMFSKNDFWRDVLKRYTTFCECLPILEGEKNLDLPLFYNHKFLAGDSSIYIKTLYDKGFRFVRDIKKDNFCLLTHQKLENKIECTFYFLPITVNSYKSALNISFKNKQVSTYPMLSAYLKPIIKATNLNKDI